MAENVSDAPRWAKLARLRAILDGPAAIVAFSGGADSAFLAWVAHDVQGSRSLAVTADSSSLPRSELEAAVAFAERFGLNHRVVATTELDDERYRRNGGDRCYFCKSSLMEAMEAIARDLPGAEICVGVNLDDLGDHRPGQAAVRERGGRWPLVDAQLSKSEIRTLSRELGLPTWDKPAAACLSSRLAYGVEVTPTALGRVERAEELLADLGFTGRLRVRDEGRNLARVEVEAAQLSRALELRAEIVAGLRAFGFAFVTLDLEGYRQGSQNIVLKPAARIPVT